jgi:hypothetical protein
MGRITQVEQGDPIEGVGEQHRRRHGKLLWQFPLPIQVVVDPGRAAWRQFVEFFGRDVLDQIKDLFPNWTPRPFENDSAVVDLGDQIRPRLNPGRSADLGGKRYDSVRIGFHNRGHGFNSERHSCFDEASMPLSIPPGSVKAEWNCGVHAHFSAGRGTRTSRKPWSSSRWCWWIG